MNYAVNDPAALRRVLDELFAAPSVVRFDEKLYGTQSVVGGILTFGWQIIGGVFDVSALLLHECAHFVEIDTRRMSVHGWGFVYPNMKYSNGRYGNSWSEPSTMKITARELRVSAFQHHACVHFGLPSPRWRLASDLRHLPDSYRVPGRNDAASGRWMIAHFDRLVASPRYRYDVFRQEWWRRNALLSKRAAYRAVGSGNGSVHVHDRSDR